MYLEDLLKKIERSEIQKVLLFLPLLNGEWEILSALTPGKGSDVALQGLRVTPPRVVDWSKLAQGTLVESNRRGSLHSFSFLSEGQGEKVLLFYFAPCPLLLLVFVLTRDITGDIREVLGNNPLPSRLYEAWVEHNRRLVLDRFLLSFVVFLEGIDAYTYHHSLRVAVLAEQIASRLGLSKERQEAVRVAGLIHDLGKLFVPREILLKPGKLTEEEFKEVKRHVLELDRIFLGNEFVEPYVFLARYHHERLDGSGYLGLREEEIPLESQILAVCDVFDALAHDRPYREAYSLEGTIRELTILGETGKLNQEAIRALLSEIPEYYLSPLEGERVPLFPGLEVAVQRIREGKEEVYLGKVGESEEEKTVIVFPFSAPPLEPGEEVLISYELSYLTIEAKARYLLQSGERYFFSLERAMRRRKSFTLPWSLELYFLKVEGKDLKDLVRELVQNPKGLRRARTEAVGGEHISLLVEDKSLRVGDRVVLLFEAYGERFVIPGRVTRVEDLGFAHRTLVEDFALPEREIDRLYGVIFRRQRELRRGFSRRTP
uniref:HD domain-containing protein n=1 Tax=Candidatus Caldatribacterium saccharofermentans TaxID=1454753 RepID=A0A7V4TEV7_9BACT